MLPTTVGYIQFCLNAEYEIISSTREEQLLWMARCIMGGKLLYYIITWFHKYYTPSFMASK
jgi:hypothetical protein